MESGMVTIDAAVYKKVLRMADAWNITRMRVPYDDADMGLQDYFDKLGVTWNEKTEQWFVPKPKSHRWPESPEDEARGEFSD